MRFITTMAIPKGYIRMEQNENALFKSYLKELIFHICS